MIAETATTWPDVALAAVMFGGFVAALWVLFKYL